MYHSQSQPLPLRLYSVPKDVAAVAAPEAGSVKLFGKWDAQEVEIKDISLQGECRYVRFGAIEIRKK